MVTSQKKPPLGINSMKHLQDFVCSKLQNGDEKNLQINGDTYSIHGLKDWELV